MDLFQTLHCIIRLLGFIVKSFQYISLADSEKQRFYTDITVFRDQSTSNQRSPDANVPS
jgi:hypothetical protein